MPVIAVPLALQHRGYIDHWIEAGFECGTPIKNTGTGAAMMRIEARRVFPRCWFNDSTTEAGRDALGYYHERQDEKRSTRLRVNNPSLCFNPGLGRNPQRVGQVVLLKPDRMLEMCS